MWLIAIAGLLFPNLNHYGIWPRNPLGLIGIFTSPFLHADLYKFPSHIINNTLFLIFLLPITLLFYPKTAKKSIWLIIVISGILVWLFARSNNHIGSSGLIFGLITFLLFSGIFRRHLKAILSSLTFLLLYSIVIYGVFPKKWNQIWIVLKSFFINFISGVLPQQNFVSWEGHLFGALSGLLIAFFYRKQKD